MNKIIIFLVIANCLFSLYLGSVLIKTNEHQIFLANKELALEREIQAFFEMLPIKNKIGLFEYLEMKKQEK